MKKESKEKKVPEKKIKAVDGLVELIGKSNAILIVSIKNLPARQFQLIKKELKNDAIIKVIKKNMINKVIDKIEKGAIKNLKKYVKEDEAFVFSKMDPFEISAMLSKNKSMAKAKTGQAVNNDIIIEAGPTELVPGPIISELGSFGLKFSIENGKISIRESKVILKAGGIVDDKTASIMAKFDMKPIAIGLEPIVAYNIKEDKIYEDIKIDTDKTLAEIKTISGKALAFSVKIVYCCKETISFLLMKAKSYESALGKLIKEEKQEEKKAEEKKEEKPAEQPLQSEQNQTDKQNKTSEQDPIKQNVQGGQ